MAAAVGDADEAFTRKVRELRELYRGRFSETEARALLLSQAGDVKAAASFIFTAEPTEVRKYLTDTNPDIVDELRKDSEDVEDQLKHGVRGTVRLFACESCDNSWWKRVPQRKEVSKCNKCKVKYDPVPRDREWGWAEFHCECGNTFAGYGQMGATESKCYSCGTGCIPSKIFPPRKHKTRPKSDSRHSCDNPDCYNKDVPTRSARKGTDEDQNSSPGNVYPGDLDDMNSQLSLISLKGKKRQKPARRGRRRSDDASGQNPGDGHCVHPKSAARRGGKKIMYPSRKHVSTGSTVDTFMTLEGGTIVTKSFVSHLSDVEEFD